MDALEMSSPWGTEVKALLLLKLAKRVLHSVFYAPVSLPSFSPISYNRWFPPPILKPVTIERC